MTRKADLLGQSSGFARAGNARSPRRQTIDASFGAPEVRTELPLRLISHHPDNPREAIGNVDQLADTIAEVGLVNPITVSSVEAFVRERPERASELEPGAEYVVVDGHRRLKAAQQIELPLIKVYIDDTHVSSDEAFLEAAFVANTQRENMTELEEAQALEKLVKFYGSQGKAAKRLGITQAQISYRLSLLKLDPELQADLDAGRRKVEHVRGLATKSPEQQRAIADQRAEEARRTAEEQRARKQKRGAEPPQPASPHNGVMGPAEAAGATTTHNGVMTQATDRDAATTHNGVMTPRGDEQAAASKVPRPAQPSGPSPDAQQDDEPALPQPMPWHDSREVAAIAGLKMTTEAFRGLLVELLADAFLKMTAEAFGELLSQAQAVAAQRDTRA